MFARLSHHTLTYGLPLLSTVPPPAHYIGDILDYICTVGEKWKIYYLWRPKLSDPKDEMVLELAVTSQSDFIVTFNKSDFQEARKFGIDVVDPAEFLKKLEART